MAGLALATRPASRPAHTGYGGRRTTWVWGRGLDLVNGRSNKSLFAVQASARSVFVDRGLCVVAHVRLASVLARRRVDSRTFLRALPARPIHWIPQTPQTLDRKNRRRSRQESSSSRQSTSQSASAAGSTAARSVSATATRSSAAGASAHPVAARSRSDASRSRCRPEFARHRRPHHLHRQSPHPQRHPKGPHLLSRRRSL